VRLEGERDVDYLPIYGYPNGFGLEGGRTSADSKCDQVFRQVGDSRPSSYQRRFIVNCKSLAVLDRHQLAAQSGLGRVVPISTSYCAPLTPPTTLTPVLDEISCTSREVHHNCSRGPVLCNKPNTLHSARIPPSERSYTLQNDLYFASAPSLRLLLRTATFPRTCKSPNEWRHPIIFLPSGLRLLVRPFRFYFHFHV
jgi:hypothetical protein